MVPFYSKAEFTFSLEELIMITKSKFLSNVELGSSVNFRTSIEEWTPNENDYFDIVRSEPLVSDYEYYPFAFPVPDDYIQLECPIKP